MTKKRIVFIYQFLTFGGVESIIKNRIKYLKEYAEIDLIFLYDLGAKDIFNDLPVKLYIEKNIMKVKDLILNNKYDIVVSIDTPQVHRILKMLPKYTEVILEIHTGYYENREYIREKNIPKNTKIIIVPSNHFKNLIEQEIAPLIIPIEIVPNPVGEDFFNSEINFEITKNQDVIPILWIGRFDNLKNWRESVKIFSLLLQENKYKFEFLFIGGYKSFNSEIKGFLDYLKKYKIMPFTIWLPYVNHQNIQKIYRLIDKRGGLFLSTSKSESFGLTVAESMASMCPIVASNIQAYKELLDDGKAGYLYELGNPNDAKEKIISVLENQELKQEKVIYGYNKANEYFFPKKVVERWLNILSIK